MASPFGGIAAGIAPEHRTLAAQALAHGTPTVEVGRRFAYVLFEPHLLAGRPIHQPITRNAQSDAAFDSITYGKGGQVVAMIASLRRAAALG